MEPIRCFSCGKVLGGKYERYNNLVLEGMNRKNALNMIGVTRECCRRMVLSSINLVDKLLQFPESPAGVSCKKEDHKTK